MGEGEEWWEGVDVWNQVFRLRFSGRTDSAAKAATLNPGSVKRLIILVVGFFFAVLLLHIP